MRSVLIATDAWSPQINGVVRTLEKVRDLAPKFGARTRFLTPADFRTLPLPGYPEIRLALAGSRALERIMRDVGPDVVHVATEGPIGLAARAACLRQGIPLTTSYHTRFPEYVRARLPVPTEASYAFLRWFHGASASVMTATSSLENDLARRGFRNLMRWTRGVDLAMFKPRTVSTVDWPRPVFLSVGRVAVEKNLEAFLDLDLPGTKVVVGDGPQRARLASAYPGARFLGALTGTDLADVYAQADVFVFPSRTDTFGVVILEALASGLPVAAFPAMGPLDILDGTRAGIMSDDLRLAALGCLTVDRSQCLAVAAGYCWDTSIRQFVDNLAMACHARSMPGRGTSAEAEARLPLGR